MAQYSELAKSDVEFLMSQFISEQVASFRGLDGGWENTNCLVTTRKSKYVLTICEEKSIEEANRLGRTLEYLHHNGFETSRALRSHKGRFISIWNDKPVMLRSYIEGKVVPDLPDRLIHRTGRSMARLHLIKPPDFLPRMLTFGKEQFYKIQRNESDRDFADWLGSRMEYCLPFMTDDLPKVLIHGDIFSDNIIVGDEGEKVTIMDFEEACYYYRVFDLAMAIIGICTEVDRINFDKVKCLLTGYQEVINLDLFERKALKPFTVYAGAAMTFWRYHTFRYTRRDTSLLDHYIGLKNPTDFVYDQPDDCISRLI